MHAAQDLTQQALAAMNATPSVNSSPTRTTPAGQTACGQTTKRLPPERKEAITALVSKIFTRLEAIFPRTFSSAFPTTDMLKLSRREVAQELARWPMLPTPQTLERTLSEIKQSGSTWPPTIPELIAMLRPCAEDAGMPSVVDAWREAVNHAHHPAEHRWRHEAVRLAGQAVGWWELTHTTAQSVWPRLEKRFERHYSALVNRVLAGEALQAQGLIGHQGSESRAAQAERASREAAQQQAETAGMPHRMNSEQGMRSLRAALGGR